MSETAAPLVELIDSEGEPFTDGALYLDKYGDTWRAVFDATEFRIVAWADGTTFEALAARRRPDENPIHPWFEGAASVVHSSGPMTPLTGHPTCGECPRQVLPGQTWCSTRCRNADDSHDRHDYATEVDTDA